MLRGYVLHHRPYKETSALVNLLVDGVGRVDAIVRLGSGKRSLKSIIRPFQPLIFQYLGKGDLKTLTQVEAAAPAIPLASKEMFAGLYLNELLIRCLTNQHQAESLFFPYHQTLVSLTQGVCERQLRQFECALLLELGTMPSLEFDSYGGSIDGGMDYRFISQQGFLPVAKMMRNTYSGEMLIALREQQLESQHLPQAKYLMRQLLQEVLGNKPLQSRQLFAAACGKR